MDPKHLSILHPKNLKHEAKVIKTLIFLCVSASGEEFISTHEAFPFLLQAAGDGSCRANESPRRSDPGADRTGRPITSCASHQLFWHISWWGRCHLTAAMEPLWWRWSHVLWCANWSNLLVLVQLPLPITCDTQAASFVLHLCSLWSPLGLCECERRTWETLLIIQWLTDS